MTNTLQWKMQTLLGNVYLVATAKGLKGVYRDKQNVPMAPSLVGAAPELRVLAQAAKELTEYFSGKRKKFSVTLDAQGTEFQKRVWRELAKIPYGKTCSYSDIAKNIKNAKAVRAVGTANAKNPHCIIVPCHRVIAADGTLGGYSGGLKTKIKLLALEQGAG